MAVAQTDSLVTVAIPTCNGAAHLAEAIRSVLAQEDAAFHLVVSDDCSDDDTVALVRQLAGDKAVLVQSNERLGLAGNWNQCVSLASGLARTPFVAIFHQDDVMLPGHLAAHLAALTGDDSIGLVASASDVIDETGRRVPEIQVERGGLGPVDRVYEPGELAAAMVEGNPLRCSAITLRCSAVAEAGSFDAFYKYVVDWDLWLRLARRWRVAWLARPTVLVRWHPASETHRFKNGMTDLVENERILEELFAKDLKNHTDVARLHRQADARLARAYLNRAHDALQSGNPDLARSALYCGLARSPSTIRTLARDPRLALQMAILAASPRLATHWFARREP